MTPREQLVAYLATLTALVVVFCVPFIAAWSGVTVSEAFGVGVVTGGLIGLLRTPSSRTPVAQTDSGDVNVTGGDK
jgi:hypothetical protein